MLQCQPVGLDFIETAPVRIENIIEVDVTPEQVFGVLADVGTWRKWFQGMTDVVWLTSEPPGVGSRRQVTMLGLVRVTETFLAWEEGRRFAFCFDGQSAPLAKSALEDFQLEALSGGRCRINYRVYLSLPGPLSPLGFALNPVLGAVFERGAAGLKRYLRQ